MMQRTGGRMDRASEDGAKTKGFAGRSVLADALQRRDIRAEVEEEFRALAATEIPVAFPKDPIRVERELADAFGMRLRVFEPPKEGLSQSQIDRMSADVHKATAKKRPAATRQAPISRQVAEEFALQALKVQKPVSGSARAESDMRDIAGTPMSVRAYPMSKKKDLEKLDRE